MTPWVLRLLLANVAMFFATQAMPLLDRQLALIPRFAVQQPWTVVTYMFVHGGWWHLFFNMLALFFFGPRLEARLGSLRFLSLYLLSGIGGAVLSFFFAPLIPIVGASGAVFGVLLGFARYWPTESIYIWGIFPVQARWLVIVMTVLALWGGFGGARDGIAHFAHLGGFAGGFLYLWWADRRSPAKRFKAKVYAGARKTLGSEADGVTRWERIEKDKLHEVNRDELNRILDKIGVSGVGSLTLDERAFLDRFSPE